MKFAFIAAQAGLHGVELMCKVLGVSRSGFYAWLGRRSSKRDRDDGRLRLLIRAIFKASRATYGAPRVHAELVAQGERVSRKRVARLMAEEGLVGRSPRRRKVSTTRARPGVDGENLLARNFTPSAPNTA